MRRFACERWFRGTLVPVLLLGWLLLPVLFQTRMGFQSGARWAWEWSYFALTALAAAGLRRYRWNGRGAGCGARCSRPLRRWAPPFARMFCWAGRWQYWQWPCWCARLPLLPRLLSAAALVPLCAWVLLSILVLPLGATARYLVDDPAGAPRQYAEVTIVAPGAMGRVRYHAVEQYALVELDPVARLSWVTGRDSALPGAGPTAIWCGTISAAQRQFFRPGQALDGGLPAQRRGPVGTGFPIDHLHRTMAAGVFGALSRVVEGAAALHVGGAAGIKRAVPAAQHIDPIRHEPFQACA